MGIWQKSSGACLLCGVQPRRVRLRWAGRAKRRAKVKANHGTSRGQRRVSEKQPVRRMNGPRRSDEVEGADRRRVATHPRGQLTPLKHARPREIVVKLRPPLTELIGIEHPLVARERHNKTGNGLG